MYTDRVAAAVQHAIDTSGQTVQAVARGSAVPQSTLHNKLHGGRAFTVEELARIAAHLEIPVYTLTAPEAAA
jgi:predicted transcriptional regulator